MAQAIDYEMLSRMQLFAGTEPNEVAAMLHCLNAHVRFYRKGDYVLRQGDLTDDFGLILEGKVRIESNDVWGRVNVMGQPAAGALFAEVFAVLPREPLRVSVVAAADCRVLFLDAARVMTSCTNACQYHSVVSKNLIRLIAQKNLGLSDKISCQMPRTVRGKLLVFLSRQAQEANSSEFDIAFNRQQLADYLGVDRSVLSSELSKMQREGLLETKRSHFVLRVDPTTGSE
ncbi:MAG: Crp/Fnr family transcriptional regulator [Eggerthellaceae bacterium]|jgi:CRP-like cAMP-binding protein